MIISKEFPNTIIVTDKDVTSFEEVEDWCKQYCKSFIKCEIFDVSDWATTFDEVAEFTFSDEKDLHWFLLKWQTNGHNS